MMVVASLMASLLIAGASPNADAFVSDAQVRLFAGDALPADFRTQLADLAPVDRFAVVIWLRRSGMLTGPALSIDAMLGPATTHEHDQ